MRILPVAAALVVLAGGCGGATGHRTAGPQPVASSRTATVLERQFGTGADGFYLLTPTRRDWTRLVVFVHGHGDADEITPRYHRPWLRHLAERGAAVVYPRYENSPGGHGAIRHVDAAVRAALGVLGPRARGAPAVGIGYSRGGRLVVDWAATTAGPARPRAILSVFPAAAEDPSPDPSGLSRGTRILVLTGDQDEVVGASGALALLLALKQSDFGLKTVHWTIVESTPDFAVTHLSVLDSSPRAQTLFWKPADRLIAAVG